MGSGDPFYFGGVELCGFTHGPFGGRPIESSNLGGPVTQSLMGFGTGDLCRSPNNGLFGSGGGGLITEPNVADGLVLAERGRGLAPPLAVGAPEGGLPRVQPLVLLQLVLVGETLAAVVAIEVGQVADLVVVERGPVDEVLFAVLAIVFGSTVLAWPGCPLWW